jgi:hypothetical protein
LLESLYQPCEVPHLTIGEWLPITVSNQTDADGLGVVERARFADHMSPGELLDPAVAYVDFAVGQAISVANQEVVAQALVVPREVLAMDRFGGTERFTEVVDDNAVPAVAIQVGFVGQE